MSNRTPNDPAPHKAAPTHNAIQSALLVASLVAALLLVLVTFLNSARPAGAQDATATPTRPATPTAMAHDMAGMAGMTVTDDMTGTMTGVITGAMSSDAHAGHDMAGMATTTMTHDMAGMAGMTMTGTMTDTMTGTMSSDAHAGHDMAGMATMTMTHDMTATQATTATHVMTGTPAGAANAGHDMAGMAGMTVTVAVTPTPAVTKSVAITSTAPLTAGETPATPATQVPGPALTGPVGPVGDDVKGLLADLLLLVRSHNARMEKLLAGNPTPDELAEMHADMVVLNRMTDRLVAMAQRDAAAALPAAGAAPALAAGAPASAMPAMPGMNAPAGQTAAATPDPMAGMAGMNTGAAGTAQGPALGALTAPAGSTGALTMNDIHARLQAIATMMQETRAQLQAMQANGATDEQMVELRSRLELLRYMLRDLMTSMQSAATPPTATLASPIAGAAATATANGGMMGGMMGDMMSNMMGGMMGGMSGSGGSSASSMSGMPATGAQTGTGGTDSTLVRAAEAGGVTLTVQPLNLADAAAATLDFYVKAETHTTPLDQNLAGVSVLRTATGVEVPALTWNGPTGGHHVEGTLSFPRTANGQPVVTSTAGTLVLAVRNYAGVPERLFAWDLGR